MIITRSLLNPIIKPEDIKPSNPNFKVSSVFNPGVTFMNNEVVLLLRVAEQPINNDRNVVSTIIFDHHSKEFAIKEFEKDNPYYDFSNSSNIKTPNEIYNTSISHLRLAKSKDGLNFKIDDSPSFMSDSAYEIFGVEDPRITCIDGIYYISYVAVSNKGITTCLASTTDFYSYKRYGIIFAPNNKNVVIFPEKINNKYYALHRPYVDFFGETSIWLSESLDLIGWGNHKYIIGRHEGQWDHNSIGCGAIPIRTNKGWIVIYHAVDTKLRYCLGAVLLDIDEPSRLISRTIKPILEPEADYEINGFKQNVVFTCGALYENDLVKLYYGAADSCVAYAEIHIDYIMSLMK